MGLQGYKGGSAGLTGGSTGLYKWVFEAIKVGLQCYTGGSAGLKRWVCKTIKVGLQGYPSSPSIARMTSRPNKLQHNVLQDMFGIHQI